MASTTGLEEFGAAMGFSQERIAIYRALSYVVEFTGVDGTYTARVEFDGGKIPDQVYSFKIGETIEYKSIEGEKPKLTVTLDGDKIVESYVLEEKNKQWTNVREVVGDTMTSTTTCDGKSVVQKLNRV
ncbi:lipocalin/fatty-acid binding family protein [Escherichia coli]|nr:lipocalin/fatty-acid binding family protein [Escherichia coli]